MTEHTPVGPFRLSERPAHLGVGATTIPQPPFTGDMSWYMGYGERHGGDGNEGRLLSMHSFEKSWDVWEVHPEGTEVVLVTKGSFKLLQERDGEVSKIPMSEGEYAINPPGVWHTADVEAPGTAVFITCGAGTRHKPR